ncbi:F-type H+-transporting ATPase subunit b [Pseudomonas citronellolis]|uniref:ATP synthase subunit b n=2 Tax=Pseudomonas TaxID=286 RepID=A0A239KVF4_9PSED|nr:MULTISPECIES: F0F1 ATP synthase subunit B [Pseudomonas]KSW25066.1 ATP synthase subunit B [Pseudomonas sp. ADP]MCL6690249.1 F0F1 ATP synthase subunit B [Pseudomonas sp. R3.Fl]NTX88065.1 F0F1 ATP synthase subunit B [Pseudomonas sp. UMA643]NTY16909.1 F0F1 ATP synthase subunit B [Pseudomonas sp. UMC3103]NTY22988.1 F0F1 ATP synthase subunit B [Pseudomonas sp. UMA603]NTY29429.1 F0F1 ATP synthase subunit B [Pseudomonas sp. UMC3129]NTY52703.1 F0F1 ATP synthase subunit B [Pseudomonas sp. UMC631]N
MNINATLIGQAIAFAIFVIFCMKFVWPPVIAALHERQKKIADGLDAANRAARDLELAHEKAGQQLREAKAQAAEIIEQAKKSANQIVDEAREQARAEGDRMIAQAKAQIEQELNSVKDALRAQVGALAVSGAEKILGASIDANAQKQLVDQLAAEI